jgi:hypothetical protein
VPSFLEKNSSVLFQNKTQNDVVLLVTSQSNITKPKEKDQSVRALRGPSGIFFVPTFNRVQAQLVERDLD